MLVHTEGVVVLGQAREFVTTFGIRDGHNRWLRIPAAPFQFNLDTLERASFLLLDCRHHASDGSRRGLRRGSPWCLPRPRDRGTTLHQSQQPPPGTDVTVGTPSAT